MTYNTIRNEYRQYKKKCKIPNCKNLIHTSNMEGKCWLCKRREQFLNSMPLNQAKKWSDRWDNGNYIVIK